MKQILAIHLGHGEERCVCPVMGTSVELIRMGCGGNVHQAMTLIDRYDGQVDAIAAEGMPAVLQLGDVRRQHELGTALKNRAVRTPVMDGSVIRAGLERWGIMQADRLLPGVFSQKRVLMLPGLNHEGMAQALQRCGAQIRFADPWIYFSFPDFPAIGSSFTLERIAGLTLERLVHAPFEHLVSGDGDHRLIRAEKPFAWADILAGDIHAIRRCAPRDLRRKTILVDAAAEEDLDDLRARGAALAIILLPALDGTDPQRRWNAATVEAALAALRADTGAPLNEDTYLDLIAGFDWAPEIRYLQPEEAGINRFAFIIHPLDVSFIHRHPQFRWTRFLPDALVETVAAHIPPIFISRVTGCQSPATGQKVEGYLFALGATPRQMLRHDERFTYNRLLQAACKAERLGARIMGLGAFTSVVGDAGITVANEARIAITSGNSLTVAATLEAARQAVVKMGKTDLTRGRAMVIGATGSIGSVCARLLAQAIFDVVLVSIEPEKLIDLKRRIQEETPGARVTIATSPDGLSGDCDLIVTATSAFGSRILDITGCKPGAVICDVARPPDISPEEAALRPDVLVVESGEVLLPGDVDFGYDIGLPPNTAYTCLAETALLAMEGRFEDYTLGRDISIDKVKEIYRLFKKHGFRLAGLRSFGKYVSDEELAEKRCLAERLRQDPVLFQQMVQSAKEKLVRIPPVSKGVQVRETPDLRPFWLVAGLGLAGLVLLNWRSKP